METKEFNKVSSEHSGVRSGTKFITTKFHHEVQGDLEEGTELILEKIAHFPTRYLLKDENGKIWHNMGDRIKQDDSVMWYSGRSGQPEEEFELEQKVYQFLIVFLLLQVQPLKNF